MSYIELRNISHAYGTNRVLEHVNLRIAQGELHTLLGPSGCGKTTLLRLLGGFLQPAEGSVWLDGRDITRLPPEKRRMGIVFQNYALFPHLNVEENVAYGLKMKKIGKAERQQACEEYLRLVGLWEYRTRKVQELSGGQQQRVAIARALAPQPGVLLLDEPMSNLDVSLRIKMRRELRQIQRKVGITTLFITHDQQEALSISDTVSVMNHGQIEQTGSPRAVYETPQTAFAAAFVGKTNQVSPESRALLGSDEACCLRPEQLRLGRQCCPETPLACRVEGVQYQGALVEYEVQTARETLWVLCLNGHDGAAWQQGEDAAVGLRR